MRILRTTRYLVILAGLLLLLAACADDETPEAEADPDDTSGSDDSADDGDDDSSDDGGADDDTDDEAYYEGQTITFYVGSSPGGGTDTINRLVGKYMSEYLPGNPTVTYESMPGAGGTIAANAVAAADPDGLVFNGSLGGGNVYGGLAGDDQLEFDLRELTWIGSFPEEMAVVFGRAELGYDTFEELVASGDILRLGAPSPTHPTAMWAKGVELVSDVEFEYVYGYDGSSDTMLDIERGELDGRGASWSSMVGSHPEMVDDAVPWVILTPERHPDLPDVPTLDEIADPGNEDLVEATLGPLNLSRSMIGPPGMPEDLVQTLRDAYAAMIQDPEFIEEASGLGYDINPTHGSELQDIAERMMADDDLRATITEMLEAE